MTAVGVAAQRYVPTIPAAVGGDSSRHDRRPVPRIPRPVDAPPRQRRRPVPVAQRRARGDRGQPRLDPALITPIREFVDALVEWFLAVLQGSVAGSGARRRARARDRRLEAPRCSGPSE